MTNHESRDSIDALSGLLGRRRQVAAMIAAERSRLRYAPPPVRERVASHLLWLRRDLTELDESIDAVVAERPHLSRREEILRTVPGFGPGVSATLVAELPELGRLSRSEIAALVGVSPHRSSSNGATAGAADASGSGSWGREGVRAMLYMATLTAIRVNPMIRPYYRRLRSSGKPAQVAVTASMRKLLAAANSMVREDQAWRFPKN